MKAMMDLKFMGLSYVDILRKNSIAGLLPLNIAFYQVLHIYLLLVLRCLPQTQIQITSYLKYVL